MFFFFQWIASVGLKDLYYLLYKSYYSYFKEKNFYLINIVPPTPVDRLSRSEGLCEQPCGERRARGPDRYWWQLRLHGPCPCPADTHPEHAGKSFISIYTRVSIFFLSLEHFIFYNVEYWSQYCTALALALQIPTQNTQVSIF